MRTMTPDEIAEWMSLGLRLKVAGEAKHAQVVADLRDVVDAQEMIAAHDPRLILRATRPTKRYDA